MAIINSEWKVVYTGTNLFKIEILKDLLETEGIPAEILNQKDSLFLHGSIELYVHDENVDKAKEIIKSSEGE